MQKTLSLLKLTKAINDNPHIIVENFKDVGIISEYIVTQADYNEVARICVFDLSPTNLADMREEFLKYLEGESIIPKKSGRTIILDNFSETKVMFTNNLVDIRGWNPSIVIAFLPHKDEDVENYLKVLYHTTSTSIIIIGDDGLYKSGFVKVWHEQ